MSYRVGQRVRALHDTWAGEVVALLPRGRLRVLTDHHAELELTADEVVAELSPQRDISVPSRSKESLRPLAARAKAPAAPPDYIDLHLAALPPRYQALADQRGALAAQLAYLEAQLTSALDRRASSLIVLHGRGSGTLRAELKRRLRHRPEVSAIEPDTSGRFGLGAAVVIRLKS